MTTGSIAIADRIRRVHAERCGDPRHRYRSWEHCHAFFQSAENRRSDDEGVRLACLHLGFYLASWGMYRGSSFLLQRDYLVHRPAVQCLFDRAADLPWSSDDRILDTGDSRIADDVLSLGGRIKTAYLAEFQKSRDDRRDKDADDFSDTLTTKVLLGTVGCCPAYDQYFVNGATGTIKPTHFGIRSLKSVIGFVRENSKELLGLQAELEGGDGVRYPLMKLVDMGFWQKGFEEACIAEIRKAIQGNKRNSLSEDAEANALVEIAKAEDDISKGQVKQAADRVTALEEDIRRLFEKTATYRYFKSLLGQ